MEIATRPQRHCESVSNSKTIMAPPLAKDNKKKPLGNDDGEDSTVQPPLSADQRYYSVDPDKLRALQEEKPWMNSAKYFQKVAISPSAVTKMMMHCASGVEKGIAKGGNPIEGRTRD